ncbi:hypothetical protein [Colwellia hornerae]|uniref:Uncharacterized protein n=1 Tax=Colwellia hornerae TaxID=89402 RepID=A0A5C6QS99_9GAMM|nr:hypothetical protein [Colwellia hornerae]TWX57688.1 hypothetical protein ESZ28_02935 [Colwellia hornerae]TWX62581.1 hypothetical protein ESZ26_01750 [Colwellia hornerae]TWX71492.1 hypothetical protein ESZ27_01360 [Colwellia hornerae]
MTEQLPISIMPSNDLIETFNQIKSVCNKLEAQFNFQTLTANWYGDENNILLINLYLETQQFVDEEITKAHQGEISYFADDVFSVYQKERQQITCFIAVTPTELTLLQQERKLLPSYIQAKLQKVLNLIADKLTLFPI